MEEDLLNTSVDSWDGDEDINKIIDLQNTQDIQLDVGGQHGDKYKLTSGNRTYFAKEYKASEQLLETASCSAMLSCFSHTPYPVGIKKINNKNFIVFRYDQEDDTKQETNQQIHQYLESINSKLFLEWNDRNSYIKNFALQFNDLPVYGKNYFIQLITQLCFFGLKDRHSNNILFEKNGMHHIDIDYDNKFMFDANSVNDLKALYGYYIQILADVNNNNIINQCHQYLTNTINKILNIDYGKFTDRFIRNCIVLGVKEEDAYNHYNTFINNMRTYVSNTITCINETIKKHHNDRNQNWHTFFNSLLQGLKQMNNNILHNDNTITISRKDFENQFKSKQDKLNTSYFDICNDCTNRCLSLCNSCLSLCSCRRKQTTETTYQ